MKRIFTLAAVISISTFSADIYSNERIKVLEEKHQIRKHHIDISDEVYNGELIGTEYDVPFIGCKKSTNQGLFDCYWPGQGIDNANLELLEIDQQDADKNTLKFKVTLTHDKILNNDAPIQELLNNKYEVVLVDKKNIYKPLYTPPSITTRETFLESIKFEKYTDGDKEIRGESKISYVHGGGHLKACLIIKFPKNLQGKKCIKKPDWMKFKGGEYLSCRVDDIQGHNSKALACIDVNIPNIQKYNRLINLTRNNGNVELDWSSTEHLIPKIKSRVRAQVEWKQKRRKTLREQMGAWGEILHGPSIWAGEHARFVLRITKYDYDQGLLLQKVKNYNGYSQLNTDFKQYNEVSHRSIYTSKVPAEYTIDSDSFEYADSVYIPSALWSKETEVETSYIPLSVFTKKIEDLERGFYRVDLRVSSRPKRFIFEYQRLFGYDNKIDFNSYTHFNVGSLYFEVADKPSAPQGFSITNPHVDGKIELSWQASERAAYYEIGHRINETEWTTIGRVNEGQALLFDTQLKANTSNRFRVRACHRNPDIGCSEETLTPVQTHYISFEIEEPENTADDDYQLSWKPMVGAQFYEITDANGNLIAKVTEPKFALTDYAKGRHGFKMRACYAENNCTYYSAVKYVFIDEIIPTPAVPILKVPARSSGSHTLTWNNVQFATHYDVLRWYKGDGTKQFKNLTDLKLEEVGLQDAKFINYRIRACHQKSCSAWSKEYPVRVKADLTQQIRKQLYYQDADAVSEDDPTHQVYAKDRAAFRYLDLMYKLDTASGDVVNQYLTARTTPDFNDLYGPNERNRIKKAEAKIRDLLKTAPQNETLHRLLMDIYYDQAVAEMILANLSLDKARIQRLRNIPHPGEIYEITGTDGRVVNDSDISKTSRNIQKANAAEKALIEESLKFINNAVENYWVLIDNYPDTFKTWTAKRGLISPRYIDANDIAQSVIPDDELNFTGYKDVVMLYRLMAMQADLLTKQTRAMITEGQTNTSLIDAQKAQVVAVVQQLKCYDYRLVQQFDPTGEEDRCAPVQPLPKECADNAYEMDECKRERFTRPTFELINDFSGMTQAISEFEAKLNQLEAAENWLSGETNILGLPDDAVVIQHGYGIDGNTNYHSFDVLLGKLKTEYLPNAKAVQERALQQYSTFRQTKDQLSSSFEDRTFNLNDQLESLIGWRYEENCVDNCMIKSDESQEGSTIHRQHLTIEYAIKAHQRNEQRLDDLMETIKIEVERHQRDLELQGDIKDLVIRYGNEELKIDKKIAKIRARAARKRGMFGGIMGVISSVGTMFVNPAAGAMSLASTVAQTMSMSSDIRAMKSEASLLQLKTKFNFLKQAELIDIENQKLENNFSARINTLLLNATQIEIDIAQSELVIQQELDKLLSHLVTAKQIVSRLERTRHVMVNRYFADPIHSSRLSDLLSQNEAAFLEAQEWAFYTVNALEYKWHDTFKYGRFTRDSVFQLQNADELSAFYFAMYSFNNKMSATHPSNIQEDEFSIRKHHFGYIDENNEHLYPHPDPEVQVTVDANQAFVAQLKRNYVLIEEDGKEPQTWVSIPFSTVSRAQGTNLFNAPLLKKSQNMGRSSTCVTKGGNYLDKIESVGLVIERRDNFDAKERVNTLLTYGGSSVARPKYLSKHSDANKVIMWRPQFWEYDAQSQKYLLEPVLKRSGQASVHTLHEKPKVVFDYAFKEQSVAATGWRISFLVKEGDETFINVDDIEDIKVIINHRYHQQKIGYGARCTSGTGPLLR